MPYLGLSDEKVLLAFVDKMVTDRDSGVDEITRAARRYALKNLLDERMQRATVAALPDAYMIALERLLDEEASDEAIEKLFHESGADFTGAMNREMKAFREEYLRGEIELDISNILAKMPHQANTTMTTDQNTNNLNTQPQPAAPTMPVNSMMGEEN